MAGINDYSNTAGSNTTINGIDIAEGCSPAGINNAIRQLMADIADVDDGVVPLQTPDINGGTIDGASLGASSPITSAVISGDLTVDTATLYVDSTNNSVGIGTSSPSSFNQNANNLVVGTNSGENGITIASGTGNSGRLVFSDNTISSASAFVGAIEYTHTSDAMIFYTGGANERMRILNNGALAIGDTSAGSALLSVQPNSAYLRMQSGSIDATNNVRLEAGGTVNTYLEYRSYLGHIWVNDSTERMRIDSNGRVGIGTSSPASKLEVEDSVNGDMHLRINNTNTGSSARTFLLLQSDGATGGLYLNGANSVSTGVNEADSMTLSSDASASNGLNINATSGSIKFYYNTSEKMRIDSSGNVGIGTTSQISSAKLSVSGTIGSGALIINTGSANNVFTSYTNNGTSRFVVSLAATETGSNVGSDLYFNNYNDAGAQISTAMMIKRSSGNVGIGTISPSQKIHIVGSQLLSSPGSSVYTYFDSTSNYIGRNSTTGNMEFGVAGSERMRIKSDRLLVSSSGNDIGGSNVGGQIETAGTASFNRSNFVTMFVQRRDSDGSLVDFVQDGTTEGSISVSGATVSYNGFTGTHWSRLADNSKPTILKGTILESLDEMMDWYQVHFTIQEEGKDDVQMEKSYVLQEGESVGDIITYNYEGTDYQATIVKESDVKHSKAKISDTSESKAVYGVFVDWDNDDDTVNDMYVAQTGTFVVRVNGSETVSKGDLIQSNGDGTGKVQADDIIRSSTVAKVLSTTKIETYDDGSYIVPCSLHC